MKYLKVYWCSTPDHDEDWLVVAFSKRKAVSYHAQAEGYDTGSVDAELICRVPVELEPKTMEGWPSDDLIKACGIEVAIELPKSRKAARIRYLMGSGGRIISYKGRIFKEGSYT